MDPLAHTLVGLALARSRVARATPWATTTLVAAANLPDLDVLSYLGGEDAALAFRRGPTHGPLGVLLLPLALVGGLALARNWRRAPGEDPPLRRLAALAYLGIATHPLLDLLNVYGVRLLSPFSGRWFYGDALFIVDPWFWLILGVAVFVVREPTRPALAPWAVTAALTSYLVFATPAPRWAAALWSTVLVAAIVSRTLAGDLLRRRRERVVATALALWLVYLVTMTVAARISRHDVRAQLDRVGIRPVERWMVAPVPIDPIARDVVAAIPDGYRFGTYSLATRRLEIEPEVEPKPPSTPAVNAALADPSVRGFLGWARFPFVRIERAAGVTRVHLLDGRYVREIPTRGRRFGVASVEVETTVKPSASPVRAAEDPER